MNAPCIETARLYSFETLGFDEIIASADTPNEASIRVMKKVGMTFQ